MAIPETQTAIHLVRPGAEFDECVKVASIPVPKPGPGEALLRITHRPLNPADVFSALGVYPGFQPKQYPAVLGLEGVGLVAALGPNPSGRIRVGQRCVCCLWKGVPEGSGTWQQYAIVNEEDLVPVPDALPDEAACSAQVNPVPVLAMFEELATPKGEYVIITAAGSALGKMALSYARTQGVKTVGTCRRREQVAELKEAGADEVVVVATDADWAEAVTRINQVTGGKGAWGAIDALSGDAPKQLAPAVRQGGTIFVYGAMNGVAINWDFVQSVFRMVTVRGMWLKLWMEAKPKADQRAVMYTAMDLMVTGVLPQTKVAVRPLEEAAAALKEQGEVGRPAKFVLRG
ncbi:hypothetical protein HYH03_005325 [Edaphochlamys debaryana]|uniref:Enoyl reductase (ER) domain-containing protein n=1 Tax=Edaphochlamys debaryana TaxID=47281 RepID=A0A835Y5G4_9CHLO|nr:hypothetical protein HYH03_005325 [Edaphochlamys debaryana]|eukprot:KAG2496500.1 hypothetical protein HYH03_005325 [Edaphochlamys debaryana]